MVVGECGLQFCLFNRVGMVFFNSLLPWFGLTNSICYVLAACRLEDLLYHGCSRHTSSEVSFRWGILE
jgi:hypothetical protein